MTSDLFAAVLPTEDAPPVNPALWAYLLAANAAIVVVLLVLIPLYALRTDATRTTAGRAMLMSLVAWLVMGLAGLLRRFDHPLASHAFAFAWTVALTVIGWRLAQVIKHIRDRSGDPIDPPL